VEEEEGRRKRDGKEEEGGVKHRNTQLTT